MLQDYWIIGLAGLGLIVLVGGILLVVIVWRLARLERSVETLDSGLFKLVDMFVSERQRGTAGEVFLGYLLEDVLGGSYERQVQLDVGLRVDYVLLIPLEDGRIGRLPVDAKFGLDPKGLRRMVEQVARYVPYSDFGFAVMFVPSDSLLARVPDDVLQYAMQKGVWITGPTGLYALVRSFIVLRSVSSVLARQKEIAGRLALLGTDVEDVRTEFQNLDRAMERVKLRLKGLIGKLEELINSRHSF